MLLPDKRIKCAQFYLRNPIVEPSYLHHRNGSRSNHQYRSK